MPFSLGYKYYPGGVTFKPFFGAALQYYWVHFASTYMESPEYDPTFFTFVDESKNYFGYGFNLKTGFDYVLSRITHIGLEFDLNLAKVGDVEDGDLGNMGSYQIIMFI